MTLPIAPATAGTSTRPYLIRALHEWCTENGFTPYVAVSVDASVQVPSEYVKNNEIVLNVGFEATSALQLGNEFIEFKARFGGSAREVRVPVTHVIAIYARENGQGMAFPAPTGEAAVAAGPGEVDESASPKRLTSVGLHLASAVQADRKPATESAPRLVGAEEKPEPPEPPAPGRTSLKRVK